MFIIDGKLVSSELFKRKFICNLSKCKGACCWEGDFGAPVTEEEEKVIESIVSLIRSMIPDKSLEIINKEGVVQYNSFSKSKVTPLHKDGSCVYLIKDEEGIAKCSFEMAHSRGMTEFKKPISCHLYPIRVVKNPKTGFEALNYDEWDICSAACTLGEEHQMPVFRFLKEAIIRQYGEEFFIQMEHIYSTYFA